MHDRGDRDLTFLQGHGHLSFAGKIEAAVAFKKKKNEEETEEEKQLVW